MEYHWEHHSWVALSPSVCAVVCDWQSVDGLALESCLLRLQHVLVGRYFGLQPYCNY